MTPTPSRWHRTLTRLAGAIVGTLAGLVVSSILFLPLTSWSPQAAGALFGTLWLAGLLGGLVWAERRIRHPRPRRRLDPDAFENRMIRRR